MRVMSDRIGSGRVERLEQANLILVFVRSLRMKVVCCAALELLKAIEFLTPHNTLRLAKIERDAEVSAAG